MAKPEEKFRCGACEAAIFQNEIERAGKTIKVKKVSFQKRYRKADGDWKSVEKEIKNFLEDLQGMGQE